MLTNESHTIPSDLRGKLEVVSDAEWARFVLRGLINYHNRTTMGCYQELDCWRQGLEFALACVEEKIPK